MAKAFGEKTVANPELVELCRQYFGTDDLKNPKLKLAIVSDICFYIHTCIQTYIDTYLHTYVVCTYVHTSKNYIHSHTHLHIINMEFRFKVNIYMKNPAGSIGYM